MCHGFSGKWAHFWQRNCRLQQFTAWRKLVLDIGGSSYSVDVSDSLVQCVNFCQRYVGTGYVVIWRAEHVKMCKVWAQWKAWGNVQPVKLGEVWPSHSGATPHVRALIFLVLKVPVRSLAGLSVFLCSLHTPSIHRMTILAVPSPIFRWLQHSWLLEPGNVERLHKLATQPKFLCCRQMKTATVGSVFRVRVTDLICYSVNVDRLVFRHVHLFWPEIAASGLYAMHPSVFAWPDQMVFHDSHFSARLSFYVGLHEVALVGAPVTLACVGLPFASLKSGFICPITMHHQFLCFFSLLL